MNNKTASKKNSAKNAPIPTGSYEETNPKDCEIAIKAYKLGKGITGNAKNGAWQGEHKNLIDTCFRNIFITRGFDLDNPEVYAKCKQNFSVWLSINAKNDRTSAQISATRKELVDKFLAQVPQNTGVVYNIRQMSYTFIANEKGQVVYRYTPRTPTRVLVLGDKYEFGYTGKKLKSLREAKADVIQEVLDLLKGKEKLPIIKAASNSIPSKPAAVSAKEIQKLKTPPTSNSIPLKETLQKNYKLGIEMLRQSMAKNPYSIDKEINQFLTANPEVPRDSLESLLLQ